MKENKNKSSTNMINSPSLLSQLQKDSASFILQFFFW